MTAAARWAQRGCRDRRNSKNERTESTAATTTSSARAAGGGLGCSLRCCQPSHPSINTATAALSHLTESSTGASIASRRKSREESLELRSSGAEADSPETGSFMKAACPLATATSGEAITAPVWPDPLTLHPVSTLGMGWQA